MSLETSDQQEPYDKKVSLFVPSRYGSGQPITRDDRDNQVRCVAGVLARVFGGATAEDIVHNAQRVLGTFQHKVDTRERFVDEGILRVWAGAKASDLAKAETKNAVLAEACRLRDALGQECVMFEWGREIGFTDSKQQDRRTVRFSDFERAQQEEFALMAWHRVESPQDLCGVLSLAGWCYPRTIEERVGPNERLARVAWTDEPRSRTVWEWLGESSPADADIEGLPSNDLLVMSAPDSRVRVWLRTHDGCAGPREFALATPLRPTTRLSIEFAISLLDGDARFRLADLLDAEGTTARFYREIRSHIDKVAAVAARTSSISASGFAQRLVGRLLFLRFMEEKDWLPRNGLRKGWPAHGGNYYQSFLLPLFRDLDTPVSERSANGRSLPYLNGGLFSVDAAEECVELPDSLFDPEPKRRTILDLLYRYHFTLDEEAGRDQKVSVNPEMFGRVLESLSPGDDRKKKGIHYTPEPVARALAIGGIFSRLERRVRDCGLLGINHETLQRLYQGDHTAIDPQAAEKLLKELRDLAILDPAVGSGALLVACLEVLLALEAGCKKAVGEDLRKGSLAWAKSARHYITECLYGVDISAEAVEVARLRLWLFLAVGESSPTALPDLGYNLRVGNTLGYDAVEQQLLDSLADRKGVTRPLQFTDLDRAIDKALQERASFRNAQGGPPADLKRHFQSLEKAEASLRATLGGSRRRDQPAPFSWAVHFSEVFGRENRGFDVVIANPPYVRSAALADDEKEDLKQLYRSWRGNNDLYFPFIERCLRAPSPAEAESDPNQRRVGLAGKSGSIAFIMPNFANTKSAEALRRILADGGHIDKFVDFVDHQVFPTASNYVALMFATAERRKRKTFDAQIVSSAAFTRMKAGERWLDDLDLRAVPYRTNGWSVRSRSREANPSDRRLEEIAEVATGIQTSLDDFYLCTPAHALDATATVVVRNAFGEMTVERDALFACAKGSTEIQGSRLIGQGFVLWPYDADGELLAEETLLSRFPLAWAEYQNQQDRLMGREKGKFRGPRWWRFRRPQGVIAARQQKILMPSIMPVASAYHDRTGHVTCTASGSGGGGGWTIRLRDGVALSYEQLADFLTSDRFWQWLLENGSPWRGGWRGVDRNILNSCPVPFS